MPYWIHFHSNCYTAFTSSLIYTQIIIWLNGGPGCSSLDGLLQENGPFLWQPGTYSPIRNPYSWTNLTNMVYVDQPAGTGFSPGPSTVQNEQDVAAQFKDFWKRFVDTFGLHGRKVYITGESYAGQYIPYIAEGMLEEDEKGYFNVAGVQINDPSINGDFVMTEGEYFSSSSFCSNIFWVANCGNDSTLNNGPKPLPVHLLSKRNLHARNQPPSREMQLHDLHGRSPNLPTQGTHLPPRVLFRFRRMRHLVLHPLSSLLRQPLLQHLPPNRLLPLPVEHNGFSIVSRGTE